ncbi:hypothetical protein [Sulfurimonas sp.]|uniref:hypothetical protein n=1 Tax=Sulfurimonas sp. TaxID=2022749 RepID=UPI002AAF8B0A|nr:hypothetical protein [Sulfurimonas sp.]
MKIKSHEIAMQSQHSFSRIELETQFSFSTFFTHEPVTKEQTKLLGEDGIKPNDGFNSYFSDTTKTINSIIQNLLQMLQDKSQKEPEENQETFGYTHFSMMQRYEEHESLNFSTLGHVKTDKGTIDLNLNFSMSRSFAIENRIDIYSSFDPLVINLDGDIPSLSTDTFSFDLDNDGKSDQISQLASRSGFLALDKNGDGIVNQGSELFGTMTGNGFGELSAYDSDGNHWIDENDSIFDKLQIWLKNDDDNEKELVGLGEMGIGAIFLGSSSSEFTFKTATNQTLGEMKSCGIFLNEDGSCGNISQIDFASREIQEDKNAEFRLAEAKADKSYSHPLAELLQA